MTVVVGIDVGGTKTNATVLADDGTFTFTADQTGDYGDTITNTFASSVGVLTVQQ